MDSLFCAYSWVTERICWNLSNFGFSGLAACKFLMPAYDSLYTQRLSLLCKYQFSHTTSKCVYNTRLRPLDQWLTSHLTCLQRSSTPTPPLPMESFTCVCLRFLDFLQKTQSSCHGKLLTPSWSYNLRLCGASWHRTTDNPQTSFRS